MLVDRGHVPPGRRRHVDEDLRAVEGEQLRGGEMPEVLADADPEPQAQPAVGRADRAARREEAALVEEPVRRQEDLAMDMADLAILEQRRGDEEPVVVRFLDEGDDDARTVARPGELDEALVVATHRDLGVEVLEQVAGEAELGEDDEVGPVTTSLADEGVVPREVALQIAEARRDLGEGDADLRHGRECRHRGSDGDPRCRSTVAVATLAVLGFPAPARGLRSIHGRPRDGRSGPRSPARKIERGKRRIGRMSRRPMWVSISAMACAGLLAASIGGPVLAQDASTAPSAAPYPAPAEMPPAPTADITEYPNYGGEVDCEAGTFNGLPYSGNLKKISAPDPMTVVFSFCNPDIAFLSQVAFAALQIDDAAVRHRPVPGWRPCHRQNGTGPFKVDEWDIGNRIVFERQSRLLGRSGRRSRTSSSAGATSRRSD